jgi:hypothetical protein
VHKGSEKMTKGENFDTREKYDKRRGSIKIWAHK